MEGFASDTAYQTFDKSIDDDQPAATTQQNVPNRYKTKSKNTEEKARAREARRTRRTIRTEQQEQKKREEGRQKEGNPVNPHYKISYISDSSEDSSVDENYDVDSLAESEIESLTYVLGWLVSESTSLGTFGINKENLSSYIKHPSWPLVS